MGNISSVRGRAGGDNARNNFEQNENGRRQVLTAEDFISESVSGMELNHQDYQLTLHQYLSQRYADRYNNTQYEHVQRQQDQQRQRSHETQTNKESLSKNTSYSQSTDLIILSLKGKKIKDVPPELFYHDEVTSLDLSNNGKEHDNMYLY